MHYSRYVAGTRHSYSALPDISATPQWYRSQQDNIGHSQKPYQSHGKSISATKHMRIEEFKRQRKMHKPSTTVQSCCKLKVVACRVKSRGKAITQQSEYPCLLCPQLVKTTLDRVLLFSAYMNYIRRFGSQMHNCWMMTLNSSTLFLWPIRLFIVADMVFLCGWCGLWLIWYRPS